MNDDADKPVERRVKYQVLVVVEDEKEQGELLEALEETGFECKPLIS